MTLLELLVLLKKRLWLVFLMPVVFGLATAVVCWGFLPNEYSSDVSLYVLTKTNSDNSNGTVSSSDMTASQQLANDVAVIAKTDRVVDAAARSLGNINLDDYTISVSGSSTNRIITLTVTGKNPASVAEVANAVATQTAKAAVDVMNLGAVNVIDDAKVATTPSGPKRSMYTLVAMLAGLFVAVAIIVLMDMLDTSIKDDEEIEELLGLPVIGRMPYVKGVK